MERNNTNFPKENKVFIDSIDDEDDFLKRYQYIVLRFMKKYPESRGLLLYLKYGLGKTILSIAIAVMLHQKFPDKKIIFIGPRSLHKNFQDSWNSYLAIKKITVENSVSFISSNSSKAYDKLEELNKSIKKNPDFLENSILIYDEAHLFFNSICNGASNALKIYDKIMETKNITMLFLTGNFITKRAFEVVPCFNMLSGFTNYKKRITLFPENELKFNSYFIDEKSKALKNRSIFENRILGLVAHYSDIYTDKSPDMPEVRDTEYVRVEMSDYMFNLYEMARDLERAEVKFQQTSERFSSKNAITSTYRIRTRLLSNFTYPESVLGPQIGKKIPEKHFDKIDFKNYFENLKKYSPKAQALITDVLKYPDQLQMIYSFSVNECIFMLANLFKEVGYSEFNETTEKTKKKRYALFTGNEPPEVRNTIFDVFRSPENAHGELIHVLFFSRTGAEGIDSKNVRRVHIFEPDFTKSKMDQIAHRAIRYKSHIGLPESERNVQIRIYLTVYPKKSNMKESSTDEDLLNSAIKHDIINQEILNIIIKCSVDCPAHSKNCKMCIPTNQPLFNELIEKDFMVSDPCLEYKEKEVSAEEFIFNGKKYYYRFDNKKLKVYEFNEKLNGYMESNFKPVFDAIIESTQS